MRFEGTVVVSLKDTIFDPQGEAVRKSLVSMGYGCVDGVRMGKHIVIYLEASSQEEARERLTEMARRLLANPVTETFEVRVTEVTAGR